MSKIERNREDHGKTRQGKRVGRMTSQKTQEGGYHGNHRYGIPKNQETSKGPVGLAEILPGRFGAEPGRDNPSPAELTVKRGMRGDEIVGSAPLVVEESVLTQNRV